MNSILAPLLQLSGVLSQYLTVLRVYDMKHTTVNVTDVFDLLVTVIHIGFTALITRQNHKKEGTYKTQINIASPQISGRHN
jgi:hypothetical protein